MTTQTVLEAMSALLHSGYTPFYLILTCASILFSVLIILWRRKDKTGKSSHHWVPVSATSLDPLVTSQPSKETFLSSVIQPRNAPTMDRSAVTHRPAKHGHHSGQNELFLGSGNHEDNYDSGELHCSKIQELISLWSNETTVDQHQLRPNVCELLDKVIADSCHSAEHSQHDNTDVSLSDDLPQCAVLGTYQIDNIYQSSVTDSPQTDDLAQRPGTDPSQINDLPQRPGTYSTQTNDLPQRPDTDSSRTGDLSHLSVTDTSDIDELYQRDVVDCLHTDELSVCPVADPSQTGQLSREVITNVSRTNALFPNTQHSDEMFQPTTTVTLRSCELFQSVINDRPHSPELFQSVINDRPHSPELFQSVINDRPHLPELFQSVINDRPHLPELFKSVIADRPHSPELFQSVINDRPNSPELFQSVINGRPHSSELFQPVIIDSCQLSSNEVSGSNHTKEGSLIPNSNWYASGQERNNVHCESSDVDHEGEIIHAFSNHYKANKDNSLYNKEQDCSAKHDSVDTVLTCDQDNEHHELLWQQLPLDSHLLPRSHARVRSFSTSNIVHTCHKPARELKIRQHGHMWQSKDPFGTATSCKIKAASEDSGVYSCADSNPASDLYTSSDIRLNDKFPASSCTCMCHTPNSGNDPALGQEIRYHQEPVGSILPGDAYVTFAHSFPMTRSRYRELCYSSERPASYSRRKISNVVYRRLEEINHQSYATTVRTNLRNGYCQEPMCVQTSCVFESNSQSGYSVPLYCDRIKSQVSHYCAPATVLYRNPKQSHTNRNFRTTQTAGQFSNTPPAMNTANAAPEICSYQQHPQYLLENAHYRHELGEVDTSTITDPQVQLRRKRWGKSYCLPAERTRSMQIELMSRPLSLAMPVISQSNDSLSRRKQATLRDMVQHLSTHTKGIFRKRVSINNMLTWTKDSIQKPMIRSKDKSIRKEACEIFKNILLSPDDKN